MDDAKGIAQVHVNTWQSAYSGMMPDVYLQSLSVDQRAQNWLKILESTAVGNRTLVAEIGGVVVGFLGLGSSRDLGETNIGEVYAIYVDPKYQGQGIGSHLMNEGILFLKDQERSGAMLWVLEQNIRTRTWYESRGWKSNGKSKIDMRTGFELVEYQYTIDF